MVNVFTVFEWYKTCIRAILVLTLIVLEIVPRIPITVIIITMNVARKKLKSCWRLKYEVSVGDEQAYFALFFFDDEQELTIGVIPMVDWHSQITKS